MDTTYQLKIVEQDYLFPNAESFEIAKKEVEKFKHTMDTIQKNATLAENVGKMEKLLSNLLNLEISCRKTNGSFF